MERKSTLLQELSEWAVAVRQCDIPPEVVEHAKKSLVNWLAVTWAGQETEQGQIFCGASSPNWSIGQGRSIAVGLRRRVTATNAAFANGANAHLLDFDDTHLTTVIHPSAPVYAALLSVIDESCTVSGYDVLCAFAVGSELLIRLGLAVNPKHYDVGWHITASLGGFGGAFAIAKLMKFSVRQTVASAALAGLGSSGFRAAFGTMGKPFQVGLAASNAVLATDMAKMGADGPESLMEHPRGLVITTDRIDMSVFRDLGSRWHFLDNSFKPYPCGVVTHPLIDAGIQAHKIGISAGDIGDIVAYVHPLVNELTGIKTPTEGLDGKFSAPYLVALAVIDGFVMPSQFSKDCMAREDIRNLMKRMTFENSISMGRDAVEMRFKLNDGSEKVIRVDHASGSINNPLDWPQIVDKFMHLTKAWGKEKQEEMCSFLRHFEETDLAWELLRRIEKVNA